MSIVEPTADSSARSAQETQASAARPAGSRRRRLSPAEAREIARLYSETGTPTSEIRERFGIGDSSLYRVVQRQGVALRGRTASPRPAMPAIADVAVSPRADGRSGRGRPRRAPLAGERAAAQSGLGARQRFRIRFEGERVLAATDIQDALRQAQTLGVIEITAVARAD